MRIPSRRAVPVWLIALLASGLAALFYVMPALGEHVSGATYTGTHMGGGAVEFDVTQDGTGIARFRATDIPGNFCTFNEVEINFGTPLLINNHAFSRQVGSGLSLEGTFTGGGNAQGTLRNVTSGPSPCDTGVVSWSAAAPGASPSQTSEPGSQTPTQSPSPSPTLQPTPTGGPTVTPIPGDQLFWGDVNCSGAGTAGSPSSGGGVNIGDAIVVARDLIDLTNNIPAGCPPIGTIVSTSVGPLLVGDVNCDGVVNIGDAIGVARDQVNLPVNQGTPCLPIGNPFLS